MGGRTRAEVWTQPASRLAIAAIVAIVVGGCSNAPASTAQRVSALVASPARLLKTARYVPAERVAEITEGRVRLDLRGDELA